MKIEQLIKADFRSLFREPTLWAALLAPFLIVAVVLLGFPLLDSFVSNRWDTSISPYFRVASLFFTLIIAMVYGIISSFLILDEKDESVLTFIKVTPFSLKGYLQYRLGFAYVSSFIATLFYVIAISVSGYISIAEALFLLFVVPLEAIFMTLCVVAFSSNKVEGLAIAKVLGLIPFTFVAGYFLTTWYQWLFILFPPFWISKTFEAQSILMAIIYGGVTVAMHLLFIHLCMKKFMYRIHK